MRHRRPPPLPPALGGIVIDGANVVADAPGWTRDRLQQAVRWFHSWRADLPITVFLDASTLRRCDAEAGIDGGADLRLCGRGERADVRLLQQARQQRALVVSNDRFFDHEELRRNAVTVQFAWSSAGLQPFAEATWFRTPGQAVRVAMAMLQRPS
jgi:hypothetical protein